MSATSLLPSLPGGARILLIRLRSIGDIILMTPALQLLKEWRPDLRVSVLIDCRFRELLEGNRDIDEILHLPHETGWRAAIGRLRVAGELRRRRFVLCVNLHGGPTSILLTRASGARWRVGFRHFRSPSPYRILVPDARTILGQPVIHTAELQAGVFFYLGLPQRRAVPRARLFVSVARQDWWRERRARLGLSPDAEYAILHPGALYATKQWAVEKFAQLGRHLEWENGLAPVYACGPGESGLLDAIARAAEGPIRRLEDCGLGEFAAAVAGARLFVGNDSGPAHMAAALARPTVVIFGSSSSGIWGPWPRQTQGRETFVVQNPYPCNPCPGDRCYRFERPECILSVRFEQVRAAVEAVLAADGRASHEQAAL